MRLRNVHIIISTLCAIAGVMIAGIQTFRLQEPSSVNSGAEETGSTGKSSVVGDFNAGGIAQARANVTEVTPSEPPGLAVASLDRARILPGTRPDVPAKYPVIDLFDGNPATRVTARDGDTDLDFILELPFAEPITISGVEIEGSESPAAAPVTLEVMVLPDGNMAGGGLQVTSLALSPGAGTQKFPLPPQAGRAVWIRVAGKPGQAETTIGDIKLLSPATK